MQRGAWDPGPFYFASPTSVLLSSTAARAPIRGSGQRGQEQEVQQNQPVAPSDSLRHVNMLYVLYYLQSSCVCLLVCCLFPPNISFRSWGLCFLCHCFPQTRDNGWHVVEAHQISSE